MGNKASGDAGNDAGQPGQEGNGSEDIDCVQMYADRGQANVYGGL